MFKGVSKFLAGLFGGGDNGEGRGDGAHAKRVRSGSQTRSGPGSGSGGFSWRKEVAVARQAVVARALYGSGGVQGLDWCADTLRMDGDGDVAHGFLSGDGGGRGGGGGAMLPSAAPPQGCSVEVARVDRATGMVVFVAVRDRPAGGAQWGMD